MGHSYGRKKKVPGCLLLNCGQAIKKKIIILPEMYTSFSTLKVEVIRIRIRYDSIIFPVNSYLYLFE